MRKYCLQVCTSWSVANVLNKVACILASNSYAFRVASPSLHTFIQPFRLKVFLSKSLIWVWSVMVVVRLEEWGCPSESGRVMIVTLLLLLCSNEADDDQDFVFEEFVRLRVAGVDEGPTNETDAWPRPLPLPHPPVTAGSTNICCTYPWKFRFLRTFKYNVDHNIV